MKSKKADFSNATHEQQKARLLRQGVNNEALHSELKSKSEARELTRGNKNEVKPAGNKPWLNPRKKRNKAALEARASGSEV